MGADAKLNAIQLTDRFGRDLHYDNPLWACCSICLGDYTKPEPSNTAWASVPSPDVRFFMFGDIGFLRKGSVKSLSGGNRVHRLTIMLDNTDTLYHAYMKKGLIKVEELDNFSKKCDYDTVNLNPNSIAFLVEYMRIWNIFKEEELQEFEKTLFEVHDALNSRDSEKWLSSLHRVAELFILRRKPLGLPLHFKRGGRRLVNGKWELEENNNVKLYPYFSESGECNIADIEYCGSWDSKTSVHIKSFPKNYMKMGVKLCPISSLSDLAYKSSVAGDLKTTRPDLFDKRNRAKERTYQTLCLMPNGCLVATESDRLVNGTCTFGYVSGVRYQDVHGKDSYGPKQGMPLEIYNYGKDFMFVPHPTQIENLKQTFNNSNHVFDTELFRKVCVNKADTSVKSLGGEYSRDYTLCVACACSQDTNSEQFKFYAEGISVGKDGIVNDFGKGAFATDSAEGLMEFGLVGKNDTSYFVDYFRGLESAAQGVLSDSLVHTIMQLTSRDTLSDADAKLLDEELEAVYSVDDLGRITVKSIGSKTHVLNVPTKVTGKREVTNLIIPTHFLDALSAEERKQIIGVVFPRTVKSIDDKCFIDCKNLEYVDMSACSDLRFIGNNAFAGLKSLSDVRFPKPKEGQAGTFIIYKEAFKNCTGLGNIEIDCNSIKGSAFQGAKMRNLKVDAETLFNAVFEGAHVIEDIQLGKRFVAIGKRAFEGVFYNRTCKIDLPNVRDIDSYAFCHLNHSENTHLSIELPKTLTRVGDFAFTGFDSVEDRVEDRDIAYASSALSGVNEVTCYKDSNTRNYALRCGIPHYNIHLLDEDTVGRYTDILRNEVMEKLFLGSNSPDDYYLGFLGLQEDYYKQELVTGKKPVLERPFADLVTEGAILDKWKALSTPVRISKYLPSVIGVTRKEENIPVYEFALIATVAMLGVELTQEQVSILENSIYYVKNITEPIPLYQSETSSIYRFQIVSADLTKLHNIYQVVTQDGIHVFIGRHEDYKLLPRDSVYVGGDKLMDGVKLYKDASRTGYDSSAFGKRLCVYTDEDDTECRLGIMVGDHFGNKCVAAGRLLGSSTSEKLFDNLVANSLMVAHRNKLDFYLPTYQWNVDTSITKVLEKHGSGFQETDLNAAVVTDSDYQELKDFLLTYKDLSVASTDTTILDKAGVKKLFDTIAAENTTYSNLSEIVPYSVIEGVEDFTANKGITLECLNKLVGSPLLGHRNISTEKMKRNAMTQQDAYKIGKYTIKVYKTQNVVRNGEGDTSLAVGGKHSYIYRLIDNDTKNVVDEYFSLYTFAELKQILRQASSYRKTHTNGITLGKTYPANRFMVNITLNNDVNIFSKTDYKYTVSLQMVLDSVTGYWYLGLLGNYAAMNKGKKQSMISNDKVLILLPISKVQVLNNLNRGTIRSSLALQDLNAWVYDLTVGFQYFGNAEKLSQNQKSLKVKKDIMEVMDMLQNPSVHVNRKDLIGRVDFFVASCVSATPVARSTDEQTSEDTIATAISTQNVRGLIAPKNITESVKVFMDNEIGYRYDAPNKLLSEEDLKELLEYKKSKGEMDIFLYLATNYGVDISSIENTMEGLRSILGVSTNDALYFKWLCSYPTDVALYTSQSDLIRAYKPSGRFLIGQDKDVEGLLIISNEKIAKLGN